MIRPVSARLARWLRILAVLAVANGLNAWAMGAALAADASAKAKSTPKAKAKTASKAKPKASTATRTRTRTKTGKTGKTARRIPRKTKPR